MEYRTLGKSGIKVSEIGFGAWAIGGDAWGPVDDQQSIQAMNHALELGVNFFDTADVYGNGHSETLISQIIKGKRDRIILSTKGGLMGHSRKPEPIYDQPEKVIQAFEDSLKRLQTDYIDVYFCHIWWHVEQETEAFLEAFDKLKRDGKVRAVGVSTDDFEYLKTFNRHKSIDVLQIDYSILNRAAEKEILPYCQEENIGVVVRGPLQKGLLTGKFTKATTFTGNDVRQYWDRKWFEEQVEKAGKLKSLEREDRTLGQLALQFVLSHSAVSTAIPGAKTAKQVTENVGASTRPLLTEGELAYINEISPVW
ncbi:oxidoreductase [Geobacillus thermopakistaniensis]|uniref:Oxidoreductase n=1 Tax=Geobacillus thermopakistaniensis (strain MAS1) TaxID=1408282 RepID=A0A7U9JAT7_GEOTM|nr:aldo/keto reductase [Geobacillus sp. MAS1]ESU72078.1 oxidoreductase [Geobacillus sp. MAS1]